MEDQRISRVLEARAAPRVRPSVAGPPQTDSICSASPQIATERQIMSQTFVVRRLSGSVPAIATTAVVLGWIAGRGLAFQAGGTLAGHWTGTITGPEIAVEVDLATKGADAWHGTFSVPSQGTKGIPLSEVSIKGTAVTFVIPGAPGNPHYAGTLS